MYTLSKLTLSDTAALNALISDVSPGATIADVRAKDYIYIYVYMYIYLYVYIHTHTHIYIYIYTYLYKYISTRSFRTFSRFPRRHHR